MTPLPHLERLVLAPGRLARLAAHCGTQIHCREGTLWITVDNQLDDVVLERGESYLIRSRAPVIVQAMGDGARAVLRHHAAQAQCRPTLAQRLQRVWRALSLQPRAGAV